MSSVVLNVLLAVSLLAHTVFGCCWHHAHGGECPDSAVAAEGGESHCDAEGHAHHAPHHPAMAEAGGGLSTPASESNGHPAACDEPDCSYLKSSPHRFALFNVPAMAAVIVPATDAALLSLTRRAVDSPPRICVTGAALRAALQTWLV